MDKKALKLASRFAYSPNSRGYCGLDSASRAFSECISLGDCKRVPDEIKHFITLNPYLNTISKVKNVPLLDYRVIEAYWIGNNLLKDFPPDGYIILLEEFEKQGVPKWLTKDLKNRVPKIFIPHHLFQVLHVGVGQASGSVPFNLSSIRNCMIRWGQVKGIANHEYRIVSNDLKKSSQGYKLTNSKLIIDAKASPFCKPQIGEFVCVHWGQIVKILNKKEQKNLSFWTSQIIDSLT